MASNPFSHLKCSSRELYMLIIITTKVTTFPYTKSLHFWELDNLAHLCWSSTHKLPWVCNLVPWESWHYVETCQLYNNSYRIMMAAAAMRSNSLWVWWTAKSWTSPSQAGTGPSELVERAREMPAKAWLSLSCEKRTRQERSFFTEKRSEHSQQKPRLKIIFNTVSYWTLSLW